ncbi:MAG: fatty acid desaturase [Nannocystis sp.]|nr:fatty acid desaturase [Nannocystis sp.]
MRRTPSHAPATKDESAADHEPSARRGWAEECARVGRRFHWRAGAAWRHNAVNACFLLVHLSLVAAAVRGVMLAPWYLGVPLGGLVLGALFFLLLAVGVHEASHGMFFVAADRERRTNLNRAVGWLLAVPFGIHYGRHWERGHKVHHARPLEPDDPQRFNIDTGRALARTVALFLLIPGYALVHRYGSGRARAPGRTSPAVLIFFLALWAALIAALSLTGLGRVALALVLALQVAAAINQIKGALEHGGDVGAAEELLLRSRTLTTRLGPWLLPFYVTVFHFEHHLVDQVPWYRLRAFHRALDGRVPAALRPRLFRADLLRVLAGREARA